MLTLMPLIARTVSELFALPEYERTQFDFFHLATQKLMAAKDDVYASIPKGTSTENLPTTQNTMPSGEVVANEPRFAYLNPQSTIYVTIMCSHGLNPRVQENHPSPRKARRRVPQGTPA